MFTQGKNGKFCRLLILVLLVFIYLGVTGCQLIPKYSHNKDVDQHLLDITRLPEYTPGEYFVYDDDTSVLVTDVSNGIVSWQHSNGSKSQGYPNFLIPPLSWSSANRKSEGVTTVPAGIMWPPDREKGGRFKFDQMIYYKDGREPDALSRIWSCAFTGTESVTVPAGRFETVVFTCNHHTSPNNEWRGTRRFFYSPDLGHYVLRDDRYPGHPKTQRRLLKYGFNSTVLPSKDQITLNQTLQNALHRNEDGQVSFWRNGSADISAMLVPTISYKGVNGQPCREYKSIYSVKGRIRKNVRKVCLQKDASWQRVD